MFRKDHKKIEKFAFQPAELRDFYNWLNESKKLPSKKRILSFFELLGFDIKRTSQKSDDIQRKAGQALRQLAIFCTLDLVHPEMRVKQLAELEEIRFNEAGTPRYGFLQVEVISQVAGLFGIDTEIKWNQTPKTIALGEKNIIHTGEGGSAHFTAQGHTTIGDGNCALNALAQTFAEIAGFTLQSSVQTEHLKPKANTLVHENKQLVQELKSMDQETLKAIAQAADFKLENNSDESLQRLIEQQKQIESKIQKSSQKTSTLFKQHYQDRVHADPSSDDAMLRAKL